MNLKRSHWALIVIATIVLVGTAPDEDADVTANPAPSRKARSPDSAAISATPDSQTSLESGRVELERLAKLEKQRRERLKASDAFNTTSWYVPPPPPKYVAPPPPPVIVPTAPPLPFTYLGRYGDAPARVVILCRGDRVYTVAVGEVIDNLYRVEQASGGKVDLTFLPLNIRQSLATGDAL